MTTIQQTLTAAQQKLSQTSDTPRADVELLLCHVLDCNRAHLYTWPEQPLSANQSTQFQALLQRRMAGEPIAYLTGHRAFWEFKLKVSAATLIPRPETELLVEQALLRIPEDQAYQVLDLGTGSGAIALAIARERPLSQVTAIEQSSEAMAIAQHNVRSHQLDNIKLLQGDWFSPLQAQPFDIIVSNPPYIAEHDPHLQQGDVHHEPRSALLSGKDGLDAIRAIISQAGHYLDSHGWLLLEHGHDQANAVNALFLKHGFEEICHYTDLSGHVRVSGGRWPG
jgi:release factor glutamine methyltransferase